MASLNEFLNFYQSSKTASGYRTAIIHFLALIYDQPRQGRTATPEEIEAYNQLSIQYLIEERDHAADLMRFAVSLGETAPKTARTYVVAVKQFLIENDIEISERAWKRIRQRLPRGGAWTVEKEINQPILKSMLLHMDTKGIAYTLLLISSGMRPGEALKLELDDLDLSQEPAMINVRGEITKNGIPRVTFLSQEAVAALREWLKIRDRYIVASSHRGKCFPKWAPKSPDDPRLFPFTYTVVATFWENALSAAGLLSRDKRTGRKQIHPHMMRKFFLTQFQLGNQQGVGEALAGHEGYLSDAYRRITRAELVKGYHAIEPRLTILVPADYATLDERDRTALQRQAEMIANLSEENKRLHSEMDSIKSDMEDWKSLITNLKIEAEADPLYQPVKAHIEKAKRDALEELGLSG